MSAGQIPLEQIPRLFAEEKLHVRWTIKEGVVSELFSLKGAEEAIKPLAEECNVQLPKAQTQKAPVATEAEK